MTPRRTPQLVLGLLLATTLPLGVLPAGVASAQTPSAATVARSPKPATAQPRPTGTTLSPFAETVRKPDGKSETKLWRHPAFKRAAGGKRVPVDTAFAFAPADVFPIQAPGSLRPIKLGSRGDRLVAVELEGGPVTLSSTELAVGKPTLGKDGVARYAKVAEQTDLEYRNTQAGLKEELVLRGRKAPTTFHFHLDDPHGQLGTAERQPDGGYTFSKTVDDGVVMGLAAPRAFRQPKPHEVPDAGIGTAQMTVIAARSGFDISLSVDRGWLTDQKFPVVLDPTVTFGPAGQSVLDVDFPTSGTVCGGGPCGLNQDGFLRTGNFGGYAWRAAARFDMSAIPSGSTVTSANYHHVLYGCSEAGQCPAQSLELRRIDGDWSTASSGAAIAAATGATVAASGPNASNDYDVTAQVQRWVGGTDANNGLSLQLADDANEMSAM